MNLSNFRVLGYVLIRSNIYISGSACSAVGVHSQAWSTAGIGRLGSKSGRGKDESVLIRSEPIRRLVIIAVRMITGLFCARRAAAVTSVRVSIGQY
jgi:hypothetical protein